MPIGVKIATILVCLVIIFFPEHIKGISTLWIRKIAFSLIPIVTICLIGEFFQEKRLKIEAKEKADKLLKENELKKQEEEKLADKKLQDIYNNIDLCDSDEKKILAKFFRYGTTSVDIDADDVSVIKGMRYKNISFISYTSELGNSREKALTSPQGLEIIANYFEKYKKKYFDFFDSLDENNLEFLNTFYEYDCCEIKPSKGYKRKAVSFIEKFKENGFTDLYWSELYDSVIISEIYLAYLKLYFKTKSKQSA